MFWPQYFDPDAYVQDCISSKGMKPDFFWALDTFGGRNPQKDFMHTSNIVFTNGDLDPWRAGGINYKINNDKIKVYLMEGAAHHLELREPNEADPKDVNTARAGIVDLLTAWIKEWNGTLKSSLVQEALVVQ